MLALTDVPTLALATGLPRRDLLDCAPAGCAEDAGHSALRSRGEGASQASYQEVPNGAASDHLCQPLCSRSVRAP